MQTVHIYGVRLCMEEIWVNLKDNIVPNKIDSTE